MQTAICHKSAFAPPYPKIIPAILHLTGITEKNQLRGIILKIELTPYPISFSLLDNQFCLSIPITTMAKVVIIDDESSILELMSKLCRSVGHTVFPCLTGAEGLAAVRAQNPELVIVDLRIGDISGLDIVKTCALESPDSAVIMVTGHGSVETAVEAMRLGAFDYLSKPFDLGDLIKTVNHALSRNKPASSGALAPASTATVRSPSSAKLIGHSEAIQKIFELVRRVADTDSPILVEGEFGVGKHMLARAVHEASKRSGLPFKELQCSALAEDVLEAELFGSGNGSGIFQRAGGGVVHLAEIHQLSPRLQAQLNSFLDETQNRRNWSGGGTAPSFRLITSTTSSLEEASTSGTFREDLYYKISVVPVRIPPLRERREDIRPLVEHFLRDLSERTGSTKSIDGYAMEFLERYPWPGNISELRNAVERACALCDADRIRPSDLPTKVSQQIEVPSPAQGGNKVQLPIGSPLDDFIKAQERLFIQETLKYNNGSREKTASMLGVSIATLYRKMGLNVERKTTT
jgi:DNA-binding NtrC family response regulator